MPQESLTDRTSLVAAADTLPFWADRTRAPPFLPRQSKTACSRHCPLVCLAVFILANAADYPFIYLDDTDPHAWHFILFYSALCCALLCCVALGVVDPGIRTPNLHHVLATGGDPQWVAANCGPPPDPATLSEDFKELVAEEYRLGKVAPKATIDGKEHKWCFTCKLWRPLGTVHCSECGFCVDNYDHHCGVIGHCVAKGNMRFFAGLLLSSGIAAAAMFAACVLRAEDLHDRDDPGPWDNWNWYFTLAGCMYCACMGLSFGPMGLAYFGVMLTGQTMDSGLDRDNENPCKKVSCKMFFSMCCAPLCSDVKRSKHPFGVGRGYCGCQ